MTPDFSEETRIGGLVAGVDEAGRGPLAGPVTAGAAILNPADIPAGLNDSKKLSLARREALFEALQARAQIGIGWASVEEIDRLNIRQATFLAMARAIAALPEAPDHALIDGNALPDLPCPATAIVKGDGALSVDRRRLDHRQGCPRPGHGGAGATAPRLWLGGQFWLSDKIPPDGTQKPRGDPRS